MTDNTKNVLMFIVEADQRGDKVTAKDIAEGTGIPVKTVNGAITMGLQRSKIGRLVERETDGENPKTKFIVLTDEGRDYLGSGQFVY
jgi:DNA-binding MarR family transcriptional regulator